MYCSFIYSHTCLLLLLFIFIIAKFFVALKLCRNRDTRRCIKPRTSVLDPHGVYLLKNPEPTIFETEENNILIMEKKRTQKINEKYSDFFTPDDLLIMKGMNKLNNSSSGNISSNDSLSGYGDMDINTNMNITINIHGKSNNSIVDSSVLYLWIGTIVLTHTTLAHCTNTLYLLIVKLFYLLIVLYHLLIYLLISLPTFSFIYMYIYLII